MSGRSIAFVVIGDPAPQGSKRFVGKGVMVESSKRVKPWREAVAGAAYEARAGQASACGLAPLDGPLLLRVTFWLPQPTSLSKRKAALGPFRKPDLSKLIRSTEDALTTAGVIADDARIVRLDAEKRFTPMSGHTGAKITVEEIGS
jgi:crossover junction endodeoxyribonuclease RusA